MTRPTVITHNLASIDGRVALSPEVPLLFDPRWTSLAGDEDPYKRVLTVHRPGAILEGSGSFVSAGIPPEPLPPAVEEEGVLTEHFLPEETLVRARSGWLVVPDSRGLVRWMYKEWPGEAWAGWHLLVLVAKKTPPEYLSYLRTETIPYLVVGEDRVDLPVALSLLAGRFGIRRVVSTGGGRLNGALLRAGLVDEIEIEMLPFVTGGATTPALFTAPDLAIDEMPRRFRLLGVEQRAGGRILVRYGAA